MRAYHFDRGRDGQFLRSADWQRNAGSQEGQVIAKHHYLGQPPFSHSQLHSDSYGDTDDPPPACKLWVDAIGSWLKSSDWNQGGPNQDFDDVSVRYLDTRIKVTVTINEGDPTTVYDHIVSIGRHTGFSGWPGLVVDEYWLDWNGTDYATYEYHLGDDGSHSATGSTAGFATPTGAVIAVGLPELYNATETLSASVTADGASYTEVFSGLTGPLPGTFCSYLIAYEVTFSNPWYFAGIEAELDALLALVNLNNPNTLYPIEDEDLHMAGTPRKLWETGERVTVTHEGPAEGKALRVIYRSNGASTNMGILAFNQNDIVTAAVEANGESGVPPEEGEEDVLGAFGGGPWSMMKSLVTIPAGDYTKTVRSYAAPIADSNGFVLANGLDQTSNHDTGGELASEVATALSLGASRKVYFPRGLWITRTELSEGAPSVPGIDTDGTRIDTDDRPIDGGSGAPPPAAGVDVDGLRIDADGRRIDQ
jgi:hypothetical protein